MTRLSQLWTAILSWFGDLAPPAAAKLAPSSQSAASDDETRRAVNETTREQLDWHHWSHHTPF